MKVSEIPTFFTFLALLQSQTKDWPTFMCESYFKRFSNSPVDLFSLLEKMSNAREGFISPQNDEEHNDSRNLSSSVKRDSTVGNNVTRYVIKCIVWIGLDFF